MKFAEIMFCSSKSLFVLFFLLFVQSIQSCKKEKTETPSVFVDSIDSLNYFTIDTITYYHMNVKKTTFTSEWNNAMMIQQTTWLNTEPYDNVSFIFSTNGAGTGLFYINVNSKNVSFNGDNYYNRGPITYTNHNGSGKLLFKFNNVKIYRNYQKDSADYFLISGQCTN